MFTAMIVDDEEWALTGAMHVFPFSDAGFVPILATTDSAEAADCLLRKKPDLVIADIRMPEVSGLDLLHLARERGVESIFVLLSGYADFLYAQQAISYGAFEYCLKPIRKEQAQELLTKAAGALMRKQGGEGA
ncbi:MAG: response regulator, partial [Clostridiales bacterium]|nr:response regulator [Clostridiales bacterium]